MPRQHFTSRDDLALFELIGQAVWVFDVAGHAVWWGNRAALEFWRCETLEELLAKDYSTDTKTVRDRLRKMIEETEPGAYTTETWTLYPGGEPVTVECRYTPVLLDEDSRDALLIEAVPTDRSNLSPSDLKLAEATRYSAILVSYFTFDGVAAYENPTARRLYGSDNNGGRPDFFDRFVHRTQAAELFNACVEKGGTSGDFEVKTSDGGRWHHIELRIARDASTGERQVLVVEEDITSIKAALDDVEEQRTILQDAVEGLSDAFILTDKDDRVVVANSRYKEIYSEIAELIVPGAQFEDLLRAAAYQHLQPDVQTGREEEWIKERLARHLDPDAGYEQQMQNGRWMRVRESKTSAGGIAGIRVDITDLKRAQQAAAESELILMDAVERMGDGFIFTDADDRIVLANSKYKEYYPEIADVLEPGLPFVELLRISASRGLQQEQIGREEEWVRERMERHLQPGHAYEQHLLSGRWVRAIERPTESGGIVGIRVDITELKQTQEALAESESRLQDAVESLGDAFILTDADDRVVIANSKYKEYYHSIADAIVPGVPFQDLMRLSVERKALPAAFDREEAWLQERMEMHRNPGASHEQRLADGRWLRVVERKTADGGIAGSRVDITEIREAQQHAEEANQAKTEFLSSMSHELRTPLNSVIGFAQVLEYGRGNPLDQKQRKAVDMIRKSGAHLLELINEVLDLSRIESGNFDITLEDVDLRAVIDECIAVAEGMAGDWDIHIVNEMVAASLPWVRADAMRVKQVLLNLLSNAVKFNDPGGTVRILVDERGDGVVRVSVIDDGPGIAVEDQARVFTPFDRLGRERQNVEGSGVGLAISKSLVELMNGQIGFASNAGAGSTFWIDLPKGRSLSGQRNVHPSASTG